MREAAHAAVVRRGFLVVEIRECVCAAAAGCDAEMLEERLADEMRRLAAHRADADIDARLAEIDRLKLRVRVGLMQDADIAEAADVIEVVVGRCRDLRQRRPLPPRRRDNVEKSGDPPSEMHALGLTING